MAKSNWHHLIKNEMENHGDSFDNVVHSTFEGREIYREFDHGYGSTNGDPFTIWTEKRVYFPVQYDGSEWVASVPRNPCDIKTEHVGG